MSVHEGMARRGALSLGYGAPLLLGTRVVAINAIEISLALNLW
jgi:hypothetical protein